MSAFPSASATERPRPALLVDRDPDTRLLYAESLRQHAWCVDEAGDGPAALAKAIALLSDVIVTETRLPGFDGLALCALLQCDVGTTDIPVVFVTGDACATDIQRCTDAGASLVLTKPCAPDELSAAMHAIFEESSGLRTRAQDALREAQNLVARANVVLAQALDTSARRPTLKKAHHRRYMATPPVVPPTLVCPNCDQPLAYQRSHIGGVNSKNSEQWDYFDCPGGCGTFQYRSCTRKLRQVT